MVVDICPEDNTPLSALYNTKEESNSEASLLYIVDTMGSMMVELIPYYIQTLSDRIFLVIMFFRGKPTTGTCGGTECSKNNKGKSTCQCGLLYPTPKCVHWIFPPPLFHHWIDDDDHQCPSVVRPRHSEADKVAVVVLYWYTIAGWCEERTINNSSSKLITISSAAAAAKEGQ